MACDPKITSCAPAEAVVPAEPTTQMDVSLQDLEAVLNANEGTQLVREPMEEAHEREVPPPSLKNPWTKADIKALQDAFIRSTEGSEIDKNKYFGLHEVGGAMIWKVPTTKVSTEFLHTLLEEDCEKVLKGSSAEGKCELLVDDMELAAEEVYPEPPKEGWEYLKHASLAVIAGIAFVGLTILANIVTGGGASS